MAPVVLVAAFLLSVLVEVVLKVLSSQSETSPLSLPFSPSSRLSLRTAPEICLVKLALSLFVLTFAAFDPGPNHRTLYL